MREHCQAMLISDLQAHLPRKTARSAQAPRAVEFLLNG